MSTGSCCIEVEFFDLPALVVDFSARQHLQPVKQGCGLAAPMRLHKADDDVDAVCPQATGARQHGEGLADSRRRAEKKGQLSAAFAAGKRKQSVWIGSVSGSTVCVAHRRFQDFGASSAMLSRSTLTRGSPTIPSRRPSVKRATIAAISGSATPLAAATRFICAPANSGETSGSRPDPEAVAPSAGTGPATPAAASRSTSALTRAARLAEVGPRFDPVDALALYGASTVTDGRGQK